MDSLDAAIDSGDVGVLQDTIHKLEQTPSFAFCGRLLEAKRLLAWSAARIYQNSGPQ